MNVIGSFQELQAFDSPQLITLIDDVKGDNHICIGYKNQFDLINEKNGDTLQLYRVEASKVGYEYRDIKSSNLENVKHVLCIRFMCIYDYFKIHVGLTLY